MIFRQNSVPLAIALSLLVAAQTATSGGRKIDRTTEKEVNVIISSSFGKVVISRGEPDKILVSNGSGDPVHISYAVRNRVGYLEVSLGEDYAGYDSERGWAGEAGDWHLKFCDDVPMSFDIELGLGKGVFDLSGIQVKDFNLSAGASEVTMRFDEENTALLERMSIESGVSKFTGINLGNANFRQFYFEGGVGSYFLDFNGNLSREVDIDVEVGLGVLTVVVPTSLGAHLSYEKNWISRLECDSEFELVNEGEYMTSNYNNTDGRLNIRVESGLGSVKIRRE